MLAYSLKEFLGTSAVRRYLAAAVIATLTLSFTTASASGGLSSASTGTGMGIDKFEGSSDDQAGGQADQLFGKKARRCRELARQIAALESLLARLDPSEQEIVIITARSLTALKDQYAKECS